jgi:hypothetical protein
MRSIWSSFFGYLIGPISQFVDRLNLRFQIHELAFWFEIERMSRAISMLLAPQFMQDGCHNINPAFSWSIEKLIN